MWIISNSPWHSTDASDNSPSRHLFITVQLVSSQLRQFQKWWTINPVENALLKYSFIDFQPFLFSLQQQVYLHARITMFIPVKKKHKSYFCLLNPKNKKTKLNLKLVNKHWILNLISILNHIILNMHQS